MASRPVVDGMLKARPVTGLVVCLVDRRVSSREQPVRILVVGAGVIGSVYAGRLLDAGHEVVLLARGRRLADLRAFGLVLVEAESGRRTVQRVTATGDIGADERYDLVLVPVRSEQLLSTLPVLCAMTDGSPVLFFGNTAGRQPELVEALGGRALFGFPAAGGTRDGATIRYVLVSQQQTMLGEPAGGPTSRTRELEAVLENAGFPSTVTTDMDGWLLGHAAFVVPIAFALYRAGTEPARLAADPDALRLMVRATQQAFRALRASGNREIPPNLRTLYLRLPAVFAAGYWRRVMNSPRGELWFAAHSRAAPQEMRALAEHLHAAVRRTGRPTPQLDELLELAP